MNKGDYNSDKIEAYIKNELSFNERREFEEALRQDPLLQNELLLQQDIIATIRDHRRNELKQRLNRIDVNGTNSGFGGFQIGGALLSGLAVIGVTGLLLFDHFQEGNKNIPIAAAVIQQPLSTEINDADSSILPEEVTPSSELAIASPAPVDAAKEEAVIEKQKSKPVAIKKKTEIVPVLPSDDFVQETFKDESIKKEDVSIVNDKVALSTESADSRLVIVDNTNATYQQHYKYTNGQLFLYGFTKPYKILDVKISRQRYLFYDGSFYRLDRNQSQITPVQKVTNQELIIELEKLKEEMQ
jgi:hypothetical protein